MKKAYYLQVCRKKQRQEHLMRWSQDGESDLSQRKRAKEEGWAGIQLFPRVYYTSHSSCDWPATNPCTQNSTQMNGKSLENLAVCMRLHANDESDGDSVSLSMCLYMPRHEAYHRHKAFPLPSDPERISIALNKPNVRFYGRSPVLHNEMPIKWKLRYRY